MPINYYEKVVVTSSNEFPEYVGKAGVVLGISKDDTCVYYYCVSFPGEHELICFLPDELEATGELADRSEFYDENDRIRVRVHGDRGFLSK